MHPVPPRSSTTSNPSSSIAASATRVHPSDADAGDAVAVASHHDGGSGRVTATTTVTSRRDAGRNGRGQGQPAVYTVWKRSSMGFQGTDGFSVYDAAGGLAFRVDNYSRRRKLFAGELLLMDGRGAPLLALRPQILSMRDQWNCYRASSEESTSGDKTSFPRRQHLFSMRKCSLVKGTDEAEVYKALASGSAAAHGDHQVPSFTVQGSFWRRSCKIRSGDGEEVARITRKKAGAATAASEPVTLGEDVFSLTVMPDADCAMVMALVIVMDSICQRPYKPLMCSSSSESCSSEAGRLRVREMRC